MRNISTIRKLYGSTIKNKKLKSVAMKLQNVIEKRHDISSIIFIHLRFIYAIFFICFKDPIAI